MAINRNRLYLFILCAAVLDIIFVLLEFKPGEFVFKPLTTALIILLCYGSYKARHDRIYTSLFLVALIFSLFGDIFLMLEGERFFLPGLAAFLLAHLFYIIALGRGFEKLKKGDYYTGAVVGAAAIIIFSILGRGMLATGQGEMLLPVGLYTLVISAMLWLALGHFFRKKLTHRQKLLVAVGALFFYASDAVLAFNKFLEPMGWAPAFIMATYFFAQFCLARSTYLD